MYDNHTSIVFWKRSYHCFPFHFQIKVKEDVGTEADDIRIDEKQSKSNNGNTKKAQEEDKLQEQAKPSNAASTSLCALL